MVQRSGAVVFSLGIALLIAGLVAYYGFMPEVGDFGVGYFAWVLLVWVGLFILTPFFLAVGAYYMLLPGATRMFKASRSGARLPSNSSESPKGVKPSNFLEWPKGPKAWSIELGGTGLFLWFVVLPVMAEGGA